GFLSRVFVAGLDQQPRLLPFTGTRPHAHQVPVALELLAVQFEIEMTLLHPLARVMVPRPGAAIPDHHSATAILAFGDDALKRVVFDGVILDVDGKPLVAGDEARPSGYGPAHHHAVELQTEVVMQARGVVLLNDVAEALLAIGLAAWLGSLSEVALGPVG